MKTLRNPLRPLRVMDLLSILLHEVIVEKFQPNFYIKAKALNLQKAKCLNLYFVNHS
jgi:hypothetical protein